MYSHHCSTRHVWPCLPCEADVTSTHAYRLTHSVMKLTQRTNATWTDSTASKSQLALWISE